MKTPQKPFWYAIYTLARHEKKVCQYLQQRNITTFLPVARQIRQWSDRKKLVESPLFPGYLFVNVLPDLRYSILDIPGILRFVDSNLRPARVCESEIQVLKTLSHGPVEVSNERIELGENVVISSGPMRGIRGKVVLKRGRCRIVVEIESLKKFILVDISPAQIEEAGSVTTA